MDRTAELIKIDNMLHELEIKLAQNKSSQDIQRVLQIQDPTALKTELAKFDPAVLQSLLDEIKKFEMSNTLTEKQKTVVSGLEQIFEMSHLPDLISKLLPKIQGLQNLGWMTDFAARAGFGLNAAQKMNTPTPAQLQKKMKGDPIYGGNADVTYTGTAPTFGGLTKGTNFGDIPMSAYTPKYTGYGHSKGLKKLNESDDDNIKIAQAAPEVPDFKPFWDIISSTMNSTEYSDEQKANYLNQKLQETANQYGIPASQYLKGK
jgi:hypothetical protein